MVVEIPDGFRSFGRWQIEGFAGSRWLAALPARAEETIERWRLTPEGRVRHGYNGIAIDVRRDRQPMVLKIAWLDERVQEQIRGLMLWDGRGMVKVRAADLSTGALLMDRLDSAHPLAKVPITEALNIAGQLLRRLAVPAPDDGFPSTSESAARIRDSLPAAWERAERPLDVESLNIAVALADRLSHSTPQVMVDGDMHFEDVLPGGHEPWLAIDPRPMVGDIEHQCGQLLWSRARDIGDADFPDALARLVALGDLDLEKAIAWAFVRAVDYRIWGINHGLAHDPKHCLRIVHALRSEARDLL